MQQANQVAGEASPAATGATGTATTKSHVNGGRFDFDDGGTYCGGWEEGKAHGHGVCTGPKGQGAYSGSWHYGFEVSGVYTWPSGSCFEGQWQNGKRHGLGVETRGRWIYRGEWTQGFKGRYGVRQSNTSTAKYEGTWANGLQDGYGSETYADDGTYQGQWLRGMRHGYGVRNSAPFGKASKYRANKTLRASLTSLRSNEGNTGAIPEATEKRDRRVDDSRGGFVLKMSSAEPTVRRRSIGSGPGLKKGILMGLKLKKQRSTGDLEKKGGSGSIRSTGSSASWVSTDSAQSGATNQSVPTDSNASFVVEDEQMDPSVTETYMGEWKNDKRSGFGISERSDGLKYEGEWYANKKYGYGVTTFSNGEKEEGKYKNNVLITSQKKKLFLMRSAKFRERIDAAVNAAQRASKIALQKADIAISRTATARGKAEQADLSAAQAREDSDVAIAVAKQYAPDFKQPGLERFRARQKYREQNIDIRIEQKEVQHANNQIPNRISNQTSPNQIPNQIPKQVPNQVPNKVLLNQNQMPNQTPNKNQMYYNQTEDYQQSLSSTTQSSNVNNPPANYNSPQANYNPPQPNYNPPQANYNSQSNYNPSQTIYNPPQGNYNSPQAHYNPPQANYNPPQTNYNLPQTNYNPPQANYSPSNYGNPASPPHVNEFGPQEPKLSNELPSGNKPRNSLPSEDVNPSTLRRTSRRVSGDRPYLANVGQQSSIDHFDHYKRPPSRDSSVDRYSRATGRLGSGGASRQTSVERTTRPSETPDRTIRGPSVGRGTTPTPVGNNAKNGSVVSGNAAKSNPTPAQTPPFEEIIIRKRGLGQDIIPSPNQPKRTESLFIPGAPTPQVAKNLVTQTSLQRKKSLPDFQELPRTTGAMSREEVSYLGSARREEIRRQADERERLRANPLLYLVSPQVKDWFSRQQLVIIVLFINISLAIMFFKLLT